MLLIWINIIYEFAEIRQKKANAGYRLPVFFIIEVDEVELAK